MLNTHIQSMNDKYTFSLVLFFHLWTRFTIAYQRAAYFTNVFRSANNDELCIISIDEAVANGM